MKPGWANGSGTTRAKRRVPSGAIHDAADVVTGEQRRRRAGSHTGRRRGSRWVKPLPPSIPPPSISNACEPSSGISVHSIECCLRSTSGRRSAMRSSSSSRSTSILSRSALSTPPRLVESGRRVAGRSARAARGRAGHRRARARRRRTRSGASSPRCRRSGRPIITIVVPSAAGVGGDPKADVRLRTYGPLTGKGAFWRTQVGSPREVRSARPAGSRWPSSWSRARSTRSGSPTTRPARCGGDSRAGPSWSGLAPRKNEIHAAR